MSIKLFAGSAAANRSSELDAFAATGKPAVCLFDRPGTFNCMHAALPAMREKKSGLIINVISVAGRRSMVLAGLPYCVSKHAQSALGTFVALEDAQNGIKVTNIYPGESNTPIVDKRPTPPPAEKRAAMLQPEDVAACAISVAKLPARAVVPELVVTPPYMMLD